MRVSLSDIAATSLGHLGQAYLWALGLLPYVDSSEVSLVLQDIDIITPSTESTSILSDTTLIGRKKTRAMAEWADAVVTMGCGDECPYIPGKRYLDWDLPDPKGQPLEAVRRTRDEIARRVAALARELG